MAASDRFDARSLAASRKRGREEKDLPGAATVRSLLFESMEGVGLSSRLSAIEAKLRHPVVIDPAPSSKEKAAPVLVAVRAPEEKEDAALSRRKVRELWERRARRRRAGDAPEDDPAVSRPEQLAEKADSRGGRRGKAGAGSPESASEATAKSESISWEVAVALSARWRVYARGFLRVAGTTASGRTLPAAAVASLDLAFAFVHVLESKSCPAWAGQSGIVLRETNRTLELLSASGRRRCVPKPGTILAVPIPLQEDGDAAVVVELAGDALCGRVGARGGEEPARAGAKTATRKD